MTCSDDMMVGRRPAEEEASEVSEEGTTWGRENGT